MKKVAVCLEAANDWETVVGGLRAGYVLILPEMFPDVVRNSVQGHFFPYTVDERVPDLDKRGLFAIRVRLIPERKKGKGTQNAQDAPRNDDPPGEV